MSNLVELLRVGPPSFHLTDADPAELAAATSAVARGRGSAVVRRIRGSHSRTATALFDELAAALQFPAYFGANWNALRDMLADFSWLPADAYLLILEDADELLADAPDEVLSVGLRVLGEAASKSSAVPFQIVLQSAADGRVARALTSEGVPFDVIAGSP